MGSRNLKRGSLSACLLAAAGDVPRSTAELATAAGVNAANNVLHNKVRQLRLQGRLREVPVATPTRECEYVITPAGRAEVQRLASLALPHCTASTPKGQR